MDKNNIHKEFIWHKFYKKLNFNNKIFYFIRSMLHGILTPLEIFFHGLLIH